MKPFQMFAMGFLGLSFVFAGCARITTQVVEKPRVDQELRGNQGYLQGSAPQAAERPKTRRMLQTDIELPTLEELNPWRKSSRAEETQPKAPLDRAGIRPAGQVAAAQPAPLPEVPPWEDQAPSRIAEWAPSPAQPPAPSGQTYTVQKDDTLEKVASKFYGSSRKWRRIYEANRDVLRDPNRVYPGQKLFIPEAEEPESTQAGNEGYIK